MVAFTRAAEPAGLPYVLIGRSRDYAWSATSASNDNTDQFLEELCNPDGSAATRASTHYRYKGDCREMRFFNAGVLKGAGGTPDEQVTFRETVHGPVSGTVTVAGKPYAVANLRASRGREALGAFIGSAFNEGALHGPRNAATPAASTSLSTCSTLITGISPSSPPAGCRSARPGPIRACPRSAPAQVRLARLPQAGIKHPQAINPKSGLILNWNNKPAAGFGAADSNWTYQSVHRVDLFKGFKRRRTACMTCSPWSIGRLPKI